MARVGDYILDTHGELGSGGYGKVVTAKHGGTGELVACKIISTSRMKLAAIQKEIDLMAKLSHPYIISLRGQQEGGKHQYIFMELGAPRAGKRSALLAQQLCLRKTPRA